MIERLRRFMNGLRRAITQPRHELDRWQRMVRFASDLGRVGAKQLREDRAPQMAAALSYRTLFGLIPFLVVSTILVKALGGFESFQQDFADFIHGLGPEVRDTIAVAEDGSGDPVAVESASESVTNWLIELINDVESRVSLSAIGWVGVCILIYAVISLLVTIEGACNSIYRAPEGRPWSRRVPIYWTVVTLAPLAIALPSFASTRFDAMITSFGDASGWTWLLNVAPALWSFCVTWLMMFVVYKLLPNTSVQMRPALIGALVAAVLLELGRRTLGAYVDHALRFINGALGLIPVFMFWVYLMWLVVLFGLEVSAILQRLAGRRLEDFRPQRRTGFVDPAAIVAVMESAAERFTRGLVSTPAELAERTGIAENLVSDMVARLAQHGLLVAVAGRDDDAVTLGRPPDRITTEQLLEIGYELVDEIGPGPTARLLERLRGRQRTEAGTLTLAELIQ